MYFKKFRYSSPVLLLLDPGLFTKLSSFEFDFLILEDPKISFLTDLAISCLDWLLTLLIKEFAVDDKFKGLSPF